MRGAVLTAVVVVGAATAAMALGSSGASASDYEFVGYAGGSMVRAVNNTITSDLTAASGIGSAYETSSTNSAASVSLSSVLKAGAVSTSSFSKAITGGYEVVSESRIAGVNLLNGAITASAIDTTSTVKLVNGKISGGATTTFAGLKVAGFTLPVKIPSNFHLTIPNVATVYLNYTLTSGVALSVMNIGMGLYVGLLKQQGPNAVGASVLLTPTYAALGPISIPKSGHVAGVNLTPLVHLGAVANTATGTDTNTRWEAHTTAKVAGINLFNGAIRADAVTADAHVTGTAGGTTVVGSSGLVDLSIAGKALPLNAKPNTKINVIGLGTITLNKQTATKNSISVVAVDIVLGKATGGLPAGAEIQIAAASAAAS